MAVSDLGAELTVAHKRAQDALTGRALRELERAWSMADPADPGSWLRYVESAERIVGQAQGASARVSLSYFQRFRAAELMALGTVDEAFRLILPNAPTAGVVEVLVSRFGPAFVQQLISSRGLSVDEAKRIALSGHLGSLTEEILSGGRTVIDAGITNDPRVIGWRRVASSNCCSFCAMLASRGAVYKDRRAALGTRKGGGRGGKGAGVHRHCKCQMEPVYSRRSKPTQQEAHYDRLWRDSGGDPLEFRRMVEGRA